MVGIYKCENYEKETLDAVIDRLFLEHGFDKMISNGMDVVLKPNLLAKKKPDEAVTTHPFFIEAVAKKVISLGASCILCDSLPANYTKGALKSYYTYNELMFLEETGVKLNYDTSYEYVKINGEVILGIDIVNPILKADLIINLAKIKTHAMMNLTCAAKNMFGIVPGLRKAEIHSRFPDYLEFAKAIVDISLATKNQISIVDGIMALEGNGPMSGIPRKLDLILASENQFELDYVVSKIIGMDTGLAYTVHESINRGLIEPSKIKIVGEKIEDVKALNYKFPDTVSKKKVKLAFKFTKLIKPYPAISKKQCKICKICIERCPRDAMYIKDGRVKINKKECIRCFCCHEHCSFRAIDIKHIIDLNKGDKKS